MTRKQLEEKTKESIHSFDRTIEKQIELSKNEIKLEVLSKNRQAWINSLRNELSEFMAIVVEVKNHTIIMNRNQELSAKILNDILVTVNKLDKIKFKIKLLVNPEEENNKKMVLLLESIKVSVLGNGKVDDKMDNLINLSQKILKEEWNRVKTLR